MGILLFAKNIYGSDWAKIAEMFPVRTIAGIRKQYSKLINSTRDGITKLPVMERWKLKQEVKLMVAKQHYGSDWKKISKLFPNRTVSSLQQRYWLCIKRFGLKKCDQEPDSKRITTKKLAAS